MKEIKYTMSVWRKCLIDMSKIEKIVNIIYITGGLILLMTVITAMSSCSIGYQVSSCPGLATNDCENNNEIN